MNESESEETIPPLPLPAARVAGIAHHNLQFTIFTVYFSHVKIVPSNGQQNSAYLWTLYM